MAPWSRQHFNFIPAEILCIIFYSHPPYSTVLLNLTVTQLAKKHISLMEFKRPQLCCQGPAAEFNPQSVYIFTFLILLSHLTLVIVFNNKKKPKNKQRHANWIHNWVHRNVSLALKRKRETSNYFYTYFEKQHWTIESFLLRWWCIGIHIQSSLLEHTFPKHNKCIIREIMWQFVCFHVSVNESHYHTKTPHWSIQLFTLLRVLCSLILIFKALPFFFLAVWYFQVFNFRFCLRICLRFQNHCNLDLFLYYNNSEHFPSNHGLCLTRSQSSLCLC